MWQLVFMLQYPKPILDIEYDPLGVIRGLHYDIPKGLLLKLDSINQARNLIKESSNVYTG